MPEYQDIIEAYHRINDYINKTPVITSRTLNKKTEADIFLKCENFQRVGAFKMRGAVNALSQMSEEQKNKGVITHSSGNHAQAIALSAKLLNIHATIVMPRTSPKVKIRATRDTYDAEVVLCEPTLEARQTTTQNLIDKHGYTLIHPYDNENVIAGAGTAAYELLNQVKELEMIFAPIGGGGLMSGTSIATKGFDPGIQVIGVEPENVNDAYRSLQSGKIQKNETINSIADGLLTNLSERTFSILQKNVDQIITISEQQILDATRFIWERMKLVVEPSGACSLGGVMSKEIPIKGKRIGVIISGGNVDLSHLFEKYENLIN
ncbi:MAG: L-threo-3-hydroxyaspartate ammonia-lyase [Promethearchaeota archaeon]|nr:MAG: L-threo-3-hydroxyaspartate ammonia-lyase [Candidatus Lokiarchaeota archaeon]